MVRDPFLLKDLRHFFIHRSWLVKRDDGEITLDDFQVLTRDDYEQLKTGTLRLSRRRADYFRGFMDGWLRARRR
jgi:hypothetical protein